MKRKLLAAVASAAVLAYAGPSLADMAAAEKWIDEEFQPSTLSREEQLAEMEWFINAAQPFAGIDARTQADLLDLLREMRSEGSSIIVVHHDMAQVRAAFDWTLLLNVRALGCGPTAEVLTPEALRAAYGVPADVAADDVWSG